jgi:hypothetical protein
MRRRQLRHFIPWCWLLLVTSALSLTIFRPSDFQNDFKVILHHSDSDFHIEISKNDIKKWVPHLSIHLISPAANFSANVTDLPNIKLSSNSLKLHLFFPMNGEFQLSIRVTNSSSIFSEYIHSDGFFDPSNHQTRIFCLTNNTLTRYCFLKNVCFSNRQLHLVLPFTATFRCFFIHPGARPPPFDPPDLRIGNSNISVIPHPFANFTDRPAFLVARFYNAHMLWHNVMDALVPLYWTITTFSNSVFDTNWSHPENQNYGLLINKTNEILIFDDFGSFGKLFLDALSDLPIVGVFNSNVTQCDHNFVLGLRKTELSPILKRRQRNSLSFRKLMIEYVKSSLSA